MPSPQHEAVADLFRSIPPREIPLAKRRAVFDALGSREPLPDSISVSTIDAGGVAAEWVEAPEAHPGLVVQYIHGGGYTMGSARSHRELAGRVSRVTRARVLLLEYRLAPENPYPAAVDDTVAAYQFLLSAGYNPNHVALMGDSSGGGLVVASLVALRDLGEPLPAAAVCMSPWVDLAMSSANLEDNGERDPVLSVDLLRESARSYAAGGELDLSAVSPLSADLSGLPPLLVQVSTSELLTSDSRALVAKVNAAGGAATLDEYPDLLHAFPFIAPASPEAALALGRAQTFLATYLTP
jgi:epsilon-lactone hydrolase